MSKVYPYGFFFRSNSDLTDGSGNYEGNSFKIPVFLDTVMLDSFAGNIAAGNFVLEKNGTKRYSLSLGEEKEVLVEPGDSFRLLLESGDVSNIIYNYQLGFRYDGRDNNVEISESSQSSSVEIVVEAQNNIDNSSSSSEFDENIFVNTMFENKKTQFVETQTIDNLGSGTFGNAVAVFGNSMVVGNRASGEVYIYEKDNGKWVFSEILKSKYCRKGDGFGYSIAFNGRNIFIGSVYSIIGDNKNQGSVSVFEKIADSWSEKQRIIAGDGGVGDMFGSSISLYNNMLAIGAPNQSVGGNECQGAVYLYEGSGSFWNLSEKLNMGYGSGVTDGYDKFGHSVSVNNKFVVIGAPGMGGNNTGRVLIYKRNRDGSINPQALQIISGFNSSTNDMFGFHVEIIYDRIFVSSLGQNRQRGGIQIFEEDNNKFKYSNSIIVSDIDVRSQFGYSFSINNDFIIVGARNDSLDRGEGSGCGSVYIFKNDFNDYEKIVKLTASDGMSGHRFGDAIACGPGVVMITASGAGKYGSGSIYVFEQTEI